MAAGRRTNRWAQRARAVATLFAALCLTAALAGCNTAGIGGSGPGSDRPHTSGPGAPPGPPAPIYIDRQPLSLPQMEKDGRGAVRVGMLVPLTGAQAALGRALLDAAQLAVFETGRRDLVLMPVDSGDTPEATEAAMRRVLEQGAEIVLGPLRSESVEAVTPYAEGTGIPVVAFSTNSALARPGVYLLSFPPELEVERIINYAADSGMTRFAAMIPEGDYGTVVDFAFRNAVANRAGTVTSVQVYPPTVQGMFAPVRELAAIRDYQAVLLPEGGQKLRGLAPLLPYFGVDPRGVKFLGTGLWDDPTLGREPSLVHGWFAAPPPEARAQFAERFQKAYGTAPPRIASLAYDGVALAAALADGPEGARYTPERITNPNGFVGIDGIFRFRIDGHIERGLAVNQVTQTGIEVVSPAPTTFEGRAF